MRILVPIDGSVHSKKIIGFLGTRSTLLGHDPQIELVNVQNGIPEAVVERFGLEAVKEVYEALGRGIFDALKPDIDAADIRCETVVRYGVFGKTIAREAELCKADLIIMGTRGLSPVKGLFLGSVSNSVLAHTNLPLLLIRDELPSVKDNLRVVLAVDGSKYGEAAAAFIAEQVDLFGSEPDVTVVNVVADFRDVVSKSQTDFINQPDDLDKYREEALSSFEKATEPVLKLLLKEAGINAKAVRLEGDAASKISAYAAEHADIIVMGSHGYGNFKAAVLGSTAMRIGSETNLPLLVVRA